MPEMLISCWILNFIQQNGEDFSGGLVSPFKMTEMSKGDCFNASNH